MSRLPLIGIVSVLSLVFLSVVRAEGDLPLTYAGDGLTLTVKQMNEETGVVGGDIHRGDATFPFTGQIQEENTGEAVAGTFVADGHTFEFTSSLTPQNTIVFKTGGKTYTLKQVVKEKPKAAGNPLEEANSTKNPIEATDRPKNPLEVNPDPTPPVSDNPLSPVRNDNPGPNPAPNSVAGQPEEIRLKLVKFNDINMGGLPAYTMLIPSDWKAKGHIEWGPAANPFPQSKISISSPDGCGIAFIPSLTLEYVESKPMPFVTPPPAGTPAPQRPGDFLVELFRKNTKLTNVRLIDDKRDLPAEQALERMNRGSPLAGNGVRTQLHIVTIGYDHENVRMREQIVLMYARYPDTNNENIYGQLWSIFTMVSVAAPEAKFEEKSKFLYALAGTYRAIPNWWVQQFEARQRIQNQRHVDAMAEIKHRGEFYSQMSDAQFATYKQNSAASDVAQKQRIDGIYERQDYKDVDGSNVNLTFHYKHVYSDGSGNFVLTNNSLNKPNDGNYREIESAN